MDPFESIKQTFFQECDELLTDAEQGLLAMETGDADSETINAVFRAVHSVKGGAGAFGLEDLIRFAHVFETVMDDLRSAKMELTDEVAKTLLRAFDVLADHVAAARDGTMVDEARSTNMLSELKSLIGDGLDDEGDLGGDEDFGFVPMAVSIDDDGAAPSMDFDLPPPIALEPEPVAASGGAWVITFGPKTEMYAKANEAGLVLRELARLGETEVTLDDSDLPPLDQISAESAYIRWTIRLTTESDEASIREVFEFVEDDCLLSIIREGGDEPAPKADIPVSDDDLAKASADAPLDLAALLARVTGDAPAAEAEPEPAPEPAADMDVAALIARAQAEAPPAAPTPVAAPAAAAAPAPAAAKAAPANTNAPAAPAQATIRVDLDRVDRLINAVGELVIQQAMLSQRVLESGLARSSNVVLGLEDLELLTREIQDSVMAIRAQPVKSVFQRMPRLVREVADMVGKRVKLVMEGEGTEVDKTVIERLTDPITHMLRNAIDHGLETPEGRAEAGKPAEGVVHMRALHRGGRIVIEIQDDGRGINRQRVRGIAVDKGLIAEDAVLSDEEVDNLIFLPGFSTAETISDISGRGVGMDVVRRSIQALGGRISISSEPGKGSKFTMSLPLTLAVLDGMVVTAAEQTLVAPLSAIVESLTPRPEDVHYVGGKDAVIRIRDTFVPLIDVGVSLGFRDGPMEAGQGVAILVESEGGGKAALLVDAIQGQRQVVIKSLEANYQQIEGIAAATILGDGRVALILDVDALVTTQHRRKPAPRSEKRMAG
ncbi:chemotaxis protein CheA [Phenylobacterium sp. Root77]|uniref:chemotaxis protein CheA n=1 Tax=unclassified Phenylobacterium TaxID=2640670 RepID=UPI0006F2C4CC|nr:MULTISPECIES: chemotaxis protein CheA [unclassified Phenylobacterium]KQW73300.1 chemotaxis protein CheA [Phenylobacterium sp. Root1277]KQW92520.1 chemotaxis protein CheA [Phenylobacterium sp. Root1290]KRC40749.1 chemotaxis protein CheA [Phenylobacterium sp. Root77]